MRGSLNKSLIASVILGLIISSLSYFFQPLFPFKSIAHRGASAYAPENTMAAFEKAVDLGFDYIELDVRMSKDHQLVVIHDGDVKRTTNGEGFVNEMTVEELKQLDAGSWFDEAYEGEKIPLLYEVLEQFGEKIGLLIEMKSPETENMMTESLSILLSSFIKDGLNPRAIKVQSFHVNEIKKFHELSPNIEAGILLSKPLDMFHLASYRSFASFVAVHHPLLSKSFISQAKLLDYEVYSWTIKHQYQFSIMQRLKVHGIISNEEKKTASNQSLAINFFKRGQELIKRSFM
ncbi:glycerophosphodiester phosphodiesterase [Cytobacillus sp. FJAT-54145]|uniref:Glycerophosphodiester phosphodiesterase n=1 Tax=Cytobacillus spartinae TaxID=3299023 RepID=A0ABW6KHB0_9BACI